MTSMATALADVLAADRKLCAAEIIAADVAQTHPQYKRSKAYRDLCAARNELETASEALIAAWDERMKATIIRAVAAMAPPSTEQQVGT